MTPEGRQDLAAVIAEMRNVADECKYNPLLVGVLTTWADRLALLLAEAPQAFVPGETAKENADTRGAAMGDSKDNPTASENETTPATVTPNQGSNDPIALLRELVDVDWCIGYELTEAMQVRIDDIRTRAARMLENQRQPTEAQLSCGFALYGDPAICTCGTCDSPAPAPATERHERYELRRAAQYVLDRFTEIEAAGYHTRDRAFAITVLQRALSDAGGGNQLPSELRGDPAAPRTVNGEARDRGEAKLDADFATHSDREVDDPSGVGHE